MMGSVGFGLRKIPASSSLYFALFDGGKMLDIMLWMTITITVMQTITKHHALWLKKTKSTIKTVQYGEKYIL